MLGWAPMVHAQPGFPERAAALLRPSPVSGPRRPSPLVAWAESKAVMSVATRQQPCLRAYTMGKLSRSPSFARAKKAVKMPRNGRLMASSRGPRIDMTSR